MYSANFCFFCIQMQMIFYKTSASIFAVKCHNRKGIYFLLVAPQRIIRLFPFEFEIAIYSLVILTILLSRHICE